MRCELLGWPTDEVTVDLDHRLFQYAGKFVMSTTGKAVIREGDAIVAGAAFNADRTDPSTLWIRYITVRNDRQGSGLGPRLLRFVIESANRRGFDRVRIAVNNPFAYVACYRAGFTFTGNETGIAELILEHPTPDGDERYRDGLERFLRRESLPQQVAAFVERKLETEPPSPRTGPTGVDADRSSDHIRD